jgi:putative drug exporter of the RND superfamily
MATLLARLGRASYRHRGLVSVAWLAILGAVVTLLLTVGGSFDDEFTIPGSESQEALDQLDQASPGTAGISAQIVFVAPDGSTVADPANAAAIQQVVAAAGRAPQVASVVSPFDSSAISPDGRAALATVQYDVAHEDLAPDSLDALTETTDAAEDAGFEVAVGGNAFGTTGVTIGATEFVGVAVAVAVLALTFGSLLAAGMNLLTALVGIAVGMGGCCWRRTSSPCRPPRPRWR